MSRPNTGLGSTFRWAYPREDFALQIALPGHHLGSRKSNPSRWRASRASVPILDSVLACTPPGARPVARIIVLDPQDRVLLLLAGQPEHEHTWWITPGGGLEPGETFEAAAVREVGEETGLDLTMGPCVWTRHHVYEWQGRVANQYERFFVTRSIRSEIRPTRQDAYVRGHRWWTLADIVRSKDDFAPARLGELLAGILKGELPREPIDTGI